MNIVQALRYEIDVLQTKINRIQEACSHPSEATTTKGCSDTGNYDRTEDRFWLEHHCQLCDKKWITETTRA